MNGLEGPEPCSWKRLFVRLATTSGSWDITYKRKVNFYSFVILVLVTLACIISSHHGLFQTFLEKYTRFQKKYVGQWVTCPLPSLPFITSAPLQTLNFYLRCNQLKYWDETKKWLQLCDSFSIFDDKISTFYLKKIHDFLSLLLSRYLILRTLL